MSKKSKKERLTIFSTNPNYKFDGESDEQETFLPNNQFLEVWIDKHRAGKIAVLIKGFIGSNKDLKLLGKKLKIKCGVATKTKMRKFQKWRNYYSR